MWLELSTTSSRRRSWRRGRRSGCRSSCDRRAPREGARRARARGALLRVGAGAGPAGGAQHRRADAHRARRDPSARRGGGARAGADDAEALDRAPGGPRAEAGSRGRAARARRAPAADCRCGGGGPGRRAACLRGARACAERGPRARDAGRRARAARVPSRSAGSGWRTRCASGPRRCSTRPRAGRCTCATEGSRRPVSPTIDGPSRRSVRRSRAAETRRRPSAALDRLYERTGAHTELGETLERRIEQTLDESGAVRARGAARRPAGGALLRRAGRPVGVPQRALAPAVAPGGARRARAAGRAARDDRRGHRGPRAALSLAR